MATPTLKRSWGFVGLTANQADTGNNFKLRLEAAGTPRAVASGDMVLVSVSCLSTITITISDDQSNTWNTATSFTTSTLTTQRTIATFWAIAGAGGMHTITIGCGALTTDIQFATSVWYNVASASPIDGSASQVVTPANNTAPNITSGSFNTTVDGDLIYNIVFDCVTGTFLGASAISSIAYGSGFTGLYAETFLGAAAQYEIQGTHGAVNPGLTISQTTHDNFVSQAVAIKAGSSGSAPSSGISIVKSQCWFIPSAQFGTQTVSFPTSGNMVVFAHDFGDETGVSDSNSNSYTLPSGLPLTNFGTLRFAAAATTSSNMTITASGIPNDGANRLLVLYDVTGAATSPLDTAATGANSSVLTAASSGCTKNSGTESSTSVTDAASITPSTANGLTFDVGQVGNGPWDTLTSPAGSFDFVDATWNTGGGDGNALLNGDFIAHYFNPNTSVVNYSWTVVNNTSAWQAIAVAFKAAPVVAAFSDESDLWTGQPRTYFSLMAQLADEGSGFAPAPPPIRPNAEDDFIRLLPTWALHDIDSLGFAQPPPPIQPSAEDDFMFYAPRWIPHEIDSSGFAPLPPLVHVGIEDDFLVFFPKNNLAIFVLTDENPFKPAAVVTGTAVYYSYVQQLNTPLSQLSQL